MELHFARNMTIENTAVASLCSQYNLPRHSIFGNGVNDSFAPLEWLRGGSRNSDSTNQAKESSVCFLSGEQMPATGVDKWYNPDEGASNEVSSLANEKFINSCNKYGLVGKQYVLARFSQHVPSKFNPCSGQMVVTVKVRGLMTGMSRNRSRRNSVIKLFLKEV